MNQYISNLTPLRSAILVGSISSSIFFLGNASLAIMGTVPSIQSAHIKLGEKEKADLWLFFYNRAKGVMAGSSVLSALSFSAIAYLHPERGAKTIALVAGIASVLIAPFTLISMMPINHQIEAISQGDATKAPYTDKLVEQWRKKHLVRMVLGATSYLGALALRETI